jgi:acyl-CoA-binding protein
MGDDLKTRFEQASKDVKKLSERPSDDDMLSLYALYKQATDGDVSGSKPGMFDFVGRAKFEAWGELKGTDADTAMKRYIDKVKKLAG